MWSVEGSPQMEEARKRLDARFLSIPCRSLAQNDESGQGPVQVLRGRVGGSRFSLRIRQEGWNLLPESGKILLDDTPDDGRVQDVVAMGDDVAERDDPAIAVDQGGERGGELTKTLDRFAQDFELSLDGGAEHQIATEVLKRSTGH